MRKVSISTVVAMQKALTRECDWRKSCRRKSRSTAASENSRVIGCILISLEANDMEAAGASSMRERRSVSFVRWAGGVFFVFAAVDAPLGSRELLHRKARRLVLL